MLSHGQVVIGDGPYQRPKGGASFVGWLRQSCYCSACLSSALTKYNSGSIDYFQLRCLIAYFQAQHPYAQLRDLDDTTRALVGGETDSRSSSQSSEYGVCLAGVRLPLLGLAIFCSAMET